MSPKEILFCLSLGEQWQFLFWEDGAQHTERAVSRPGTTMPPWASRGRTSALNSLAFIAAPNRKSSTKILAIFLFFYPFLLILYS